MRGFPRVRKPVVPAQAGTSLTAIRDSCLRRNDGHFDTEQLQTMPLLARLAAEGEGMSIVATLLVPLHHPVDLAERVATMDIITDGRFVLSAALGYRDEEYQAFGVERRRRVSRYLECLEVMRQLWTQDEVTFHGERFDLEGARMTLRPRQQPPRPSGWRPTETPPSSGPHGGATPGTSILTLPIPASNSRLSFTTKSLIQPAPAPPRACPSPGNSTSARLANRPGRRPLPSSAASTRLMPSGARTSNERGVQFIFRRVGPGPFHHRRPGGLHRRNRKAARVGNVPRQLSNDVAGYGLATGPATWNCSPSG